MPIENGRISYVFKMSTKDTLYVFAIAVEQMADVSTCAKLTKSDLVCFE